MIFPGYSDFSKLLEIVRTANSIPAKYLKLAIPVNSFSDLTEIKKLIETSKKPVILAALGKLSFQARILFNHLGAVGTFIAPNDAKIIPDQITLKEAARYRLSSLSKKTMVCGLIGGKQVYNSIGLDFYNNLFENRNIDAVYLPFFGGRSYRLSEMGPK